MRLPLPEAIPGLYLTVSLAIAFLLNLLVVIPAYHQNSPAAVMKTCKLLEIVIGTP